MCVIIVKPTKADPPTKEIINNCFENNSNGAGFMYWRDKKVHIEKGFMKVDDLQARLDELKFRKNDLVVYHFRITTSGGTSPENTHPFPISAKVEDLKSLLFESDFGVAHNGILSIKPERDDMSDTQEFIRCIMAMGEITDGLVTKKNETYKLLKDLIGFSRLAIMHSGKIVMLGTGWENHAGMMFSNDSYKKRTYTIVSYSGNRDWSHYNRRGHGSHDYSRDSYAGRSACGFDSEAEDYYKRRAEIRAEMDNGYKDCLNKEEKEANTVVLPFGSIGEDGTVYDERYYDDLLRVTMSEFLDEFFKTFRGDDTKFNYAYAFNKALALVKDKLLAFEDEHEKNELFGLDKTQKMR